MKLEWLNDDFFCVDGKSPYYNINFVKNFRFQLCESFSGNNLYDVNDNHINVMMETENGSAFLCCFYTREEADKEINEFLKKRPRAKSQI